MSSSTILTVAVKGKLSLRTTVPMHIVKQFNLEASDLLEWSLKVEGGKLAITVKPKMKT